MIAFVHSLEVADRPGLLDHQIFLLNRKWSTFQSSHVGEEGFLLCCSRGPRQIAIFAITNTV